MKSKKNRASQFVTEYQKDESGKVTGIMFFVHRYCCDDKKDFQEIVTKLAKNLIAELPEEARKEEYEFIETDMEYLTFVLYRDFCFYTLKLENKKLFGEQEELVITVGNCLEDCNFVYLLHGEDSKRLLEECLKKEDEKENRLREWHRKYQDSGVEENLNQSEISDEAEGILCDNLD